MMKKSSKCAVCYNGFRASICVSCVNHRLNEYHILLDSLKCRRDVLYSKLSDSLLIKAMSNTQQSWRDLSNEKLLRLRDKLQNEMDQLQKRRATVESLSRNLKERYGVMESANVIMEKNRVGILENHYSDTIGNCCLVYADVTSERLYKQALVMKQISKLFPLSRVKLNEDSKDGHSDHYDQICNVCFPQGLNPLSVPPKELAASLGYMVQLLNLVVNKLAVPALHNFGFGGSCSRIWQRDSYWSTRPSSTNNEYPLFIRVHDHYSMNVKNSWTSKGATSFGVNSIESNGSRESDPYDLDAVSYSSASHHSLDTHTDLQKGIALLKQSVTHIAVYGYSSLHLEISSASSTFEAFAKFLATFSSFKEVQSALPLVLSRSSKERKQLNESVWNLSSSRSSTLLNSTHTESTLGNCSYVVEFPVESSIGGWNMVERPVLFNTKKRQ